MKKKVKKAKAVKKYLQVTVKFYNPTEIKAVKETCEKRKIKPYSLIKKLTLAYCGVKKG